MRATFIDEPLLEFAGGGRHIDPRHGVWDYGPADIQDPTPRVVKAAIIGTQESIDGATAWFDRCSLGLGAMKDTHLTRLYIPFPGFDTGHRSLGGPATHGFRSTINFTPRLTRAIPKRELDTLDGRHPRQAVAKAVRLYDAELQALHDEPSCAVVIVCRPDNLNDAALSKAPRPDESEVDGSRRDGREPYFIADFHALLKARSLRYKQPIQTRLGKHCATHHEPWPGHSRQVEYRTVEVRQLRTRVFSLDVASTSTLARSFDAVAADRLGILSPEPARSMRPLGPL